MIDRFTELAPGRTRERRRERAVAATCTLVGALMLSRIADDEALSDEIPRTGATIASQGSSG